MNKSSIDFFSKGLDNKKTRLSINVFGLDSRFEVKQAATARKPSFSHLSQTKLEKKKHQAQKRQQSQQKQQNSKSQQKITGNMQVSFNSSSTLTPLRKKVLKLQLKSIYDPIASLKNFNQNIDVAINKHLYKFQYTPKPTQRSFQLLSLCQPIARITEQCQVQDQSCITQNPAIKQPKQRKSVKNAAEYGNLNQSSMKINQNSDSCELKKKNYYISNLVLQNQSPTKDDHLQRYKSQQKFTIRKLPMMSNTSSAFKSIQGKSKSINKMWTKTSLGYRQVKQIILPSSLVTNRIGYSSEMLKPVKNKKKERSQKILLIPRSKAKLRSEFPECRIDRWEYTKDDHFNEDI